MMYQIIVFSIQPLLLRVVSDAAAFAPLGATGDASCCADSSLGFLVAIQER